MDDITPYTHAKITDPGLWSNDTARLRPGSEMVLQIDQVSWLPERLYNLLF